MVRRNDIRVNVSDGEREIGVGWKRDVSEGWRRWFGFGVGLSEDYDAP